MDFAYNDDQALLQDATRRFLEQRHPLAAVRAQLEADSTFDREVWRAGAELGWAALLVPEQYGGGSVTDQPVVDLCAVGEELGRVLYPGPFLAANVVADAVATFGDPQQKQQYLTPIAAGDCVPTWCTTTDGSVDIAAIGVEATTTATGLRLDGVARYTHDAHQADLLLVACNAVSGPSLVLVPLPTSGLQVRVLGGLDLTRRLCEVSFEGVQVDTQQVLGPVGMAEETIWRAYRLATVVQAAEAVGAAEQVFEFTVQYAKDRKQFGRAIGGFQAIKHRLADLLMELEGARVATRYAALAVADNRHDRDEAVFVAGAAVRDAFAFIAGESVQIHGGIGFTWEYDVHLFMRRAKVEQVLLGDPDWHREQLCRLVEAEVLA
ncbi:MAG: acyl-CoA/acyl-ACP dehydrogenase [bacterium]|nr:acyl-CoA/acyl-ACP dehydrogenase [bacterium]